MGNSTAAEKGCSIKLTAKVESIKFPSALNQLPQSMEITYRFLLRDSQRLPVLSEKNIEFTIDAKHVHLQVLYIK